MLGRVRARGTWSRVSRPQPTPATWAKLATSLLVRGCVGPGPGVEYLTWLAEADLPDPEVVLADPENFTLPERGDRAYAALTSVAAAVAADNSGDRWERGWRAFARAAGSAPDIAAAAARTLARCRPPGAAVPDEVKTFVAAPARRRPTRMSSVALDAQKVAAARLWATARMPYLASAIFASTVVSERDAGTIAIDRSWHVHADPEIVDGMTVEQLGRLFVHLSGHAIRDHASRAQQLGVAEDNQRARWNRCADAEINDDLLVDNLVPDAAPDLPSNLRCQAGQLAEAYYDTARDGPRRWDCGSGADGCGRPGDCTGNIDPQQAQLLRLSVAAEIQREHQREPGTVPGGWLRWAESVLPSTDRLAPRAGGRGPECRGRRRGQGRLQLPPPITQGSPQPQGGAPHVETTDSRRGDRLRHVRVDARATARAGAHRDRSGADEGRAAAGPGACARSRYRCARCSPRQPRRAGAARRWRRN